MDLTIIKGNVLDARADAILMTIDGSARGMEGNICMQFQRRWPEIRAEINDNIRYPIPLGNVYDYEPVCDSPFRLILLASTLNHIDMTTERQKKNIVITAMRNAVNIAVSCDIKVLATSIMKGGWRLSAKPRLSLWPMHARRWR